ncbi:MAG: DUF4010 domain-containing protein [Hyphomicrobiales bacterium]|nr:DUF4010 domain-containing protein [Hyphomicrobiales bacterium]
MLLQTLLQLGLALAIGLLVGVERHWRERDAAPGTRTAGLRTFGLTGLLGAIAALVAQSPVFGGGVAGAIILSAALGAYAAALIVFKLQEAVEDETNSVTTVVAAMVVFGLGAMAVLEDRTITAAAGVAVTALLASREMLHGLLRRLTWLELRSMIIILVMSFVVLPLIPRTPLGPFGGVDLAAVWTLAILMAAISYVGYVALKLLGPRKGLLLAGALGGLVSSTAVTVSFARRAAQNEAPPLALVAGAMAASAVAVLRIGGLAIVLAPAVLRNLAVPLLAAAAAFALAAVMCSKSITGQGPYDPETVRNPFELRVILRLTLLIALAAFLVKAGMAVLGPASTVPLSALGGLVDADAVVLSVARLSGAEITVQAMALAICAAIAADVAAKSAYAVVIGGRPFGSIFGLTAFIAVSGGAAAFWLVAGLDRMVFPD